MNLSPSTRTFLNWENILVYAIALFILACLYLTSTYNYLLFHSIVEFATVVIVFAVFIIVWNTRRNITNLFFVVIGISCLFIGSLDLIHMLAYKGMGVFPGDSANLPTQIWIAARYYQSIAFFIATLLIGKSLTKDRKYDVGFILTACAAGCALLLLSIFVWQNFPACYVDGTGLTGFKIASEYLISLLMLVTIGIIVHRRRVFDPTVWKFLIAAMIFLVAGELAFTSYVSVYGFANMVGHLAKLISAYFIYRAIVVVAITRPFDLLFREYKEKDAALAQSEARYALTLDAVNDGIWDWDVPSGKAYFSPHYYTLLGYDNGEFPDTYAAWRTLVHPEDISRVEADLVHHIKTDAGFAIDLRMKTKPGAWKWVMTRGMAVERGADGTVIRMVGTLSDVTGRKLAEEALQTANRQLNLLSSVTRHDILNQLMALKAYLELSHDILDNKEVLTGYIRKEEQVAEAIERQITFTREYQELGAAAPTWQNVNAGIQEAIASLPVRAVRVEVDRTDLEIYADPMFAKVFYNLIDNALRYGGERMTTIRVSSQESAHGMVIICEDNGVGVPADDKKRLFTRGFGKHTGLGLFLSREILSITGITIAENGVPGTGARFEITVPKDRYRFGKRPEE
jgi:PAS domain S-box-containing protein